MGFEEAAGQNSRECEQADIKATFHKDM